ncbi:MAG TPA: orotate phosphoribosyltransferase [Lachnospiraceae bacterium]|jgi:orotate phosphoribosyltransferase|nr:orotate phosphoribosyltransferase [Lachnospiraceae bacterium]
MQTYKINSPYNNLINLKVMQGHFATTSSHINYYIDLTTLKARANEAKAVAKSMSHEYLATTIVDTIVCLDGTNVIGAYLADALTDSGIMSMNQHGTMYITTPEVNSVGQMTFKDDVVPMIRNRHVLLLLSTITTGHTTEQAIECIQYYGGTLAGVSSIFSAIDSIQGYDIHSIFHVNDIEGYASYNSHECPFCKAGIPLDGLVSAGGITGMNFTYEGIEHLS